MTKSTWNYSTFASKFQKESGILQLMNDLGKLNPQDFIMLGGGSPSHIKEVNNYFYETFKTLTAKKNYFDEFPFKYATPQGNENFRKTLANYFSALFNKKVKPENITLTNGSQNSFFILFNLFSGYFGAKRKKILFPLMPEYIGYEDVFLSDKSFVSYLPIITMQDDFFFKYSIDFSKIKMTSSIAAIAFSKPCNPSGNVVSDEEFTKLYGLAKENNIPLIIDNAYGFPFPNVVYKKTKPHWDENIIYTFSFSKIGLPGIRVGGIIAREEVGNLLSAYNAIANLSPTNLAIGLLEELFKKKKIDQLSNKKIVPFYQKKKDFAINFLKKNRGDLPIYAHQVEGSFFLWLWFKGLRISTLELYEILKKQKVIIIPGEYFFYHAPKKIAHTKECIRVHSGVDEKTMAKGLTIIINTVKKYLK